MRITQTIIRPKHSVLESLPSLAATDASLLLVFGSVDQLRQPGLAEALRLAAPQARIIGCSTAGEITPEGVADGTCTLTAVHFAQVRLTEGSTLLHGMDDSFAAGERIGRQIAAPDLRAVLVFAPGVRINGSALVDGLSSILDDKVPVTGGLAGDGGAFRQTFTLGPEGVCDDRVVAVGLCGPGLRFGHGSFGGWEAFGPARKVTRCAGNILYELDGEPALDIYKRYLGEHASKLPASGLLFPFAMFGENLGALGLIRTILGIDESKGSLTLAGEIDPEGYLKLMHASTDKLVNGAGTAAEAALAMLAHPGETLAILVSCVGRKLVMGNRVDEEVEAVGEVFERQAVLTGFYSNGEISPFLPGATCKLHNQTMTITCFGED